MPKAATILRTFLTKKGVFRPTECKVTQKRMGHLFTPLIFNVIWE